MSDPATIPATLLQDNPHAPLGTSPRSPEFPAGPDARTSRFGAAAGMLDRLDTRPLHLRLRRRSWWKFW